MNKRRRIVLSFFIISVAIISIGFLYWYSGQLAEQKLQDYINRLEDLGFTTEEHSLADFHVEDVVTIHFFGDFRSYAKQEGIQQIYFDRGIQALYFLHTTMGDKVEGIVFHYQ